MAEQNYLCNLAECIMRNNSVNYFEVGPVVQGEMPFKAISYLEIWQPICAILVEGIMRNNSEKLF